MSQFCDVELEYADSIAILSDADCTSGDLDKLAASIRLYKHR